MKKLLVSLLISFLLFQGHSQDWSTTGNTGLWNVNTYLGTTDWSPIRLRVNNTPSGIIDGLSGNMAFGYSALMSIQGSNHNSAFGSSALKNNTTGSSNTAIGMSAMLVNTTGAQNAALGASALFSNTSGQYNSAVGVQSMLANTNGWGNSALGYYSLRSNSTGGYNTAAGYYSLHANTSGNYNIALGYYALANNNTGSQNIAIGYNSGTNGTAMSNTVSIGNNGWLNGWHNQVFLGNASTAWIGGWVGWSIYSDARMKTKITEEVKGLEFIKRLHPVTYHRSIKIATQISGNKEVADYPEKYDAEKVLYSGFLAQEVEKAAQESGYNFSGINKPKTSTDLYSLNYESFVVPLVKAVQEQQTIIEKQNDRITALEKKLNDLLSLQVSR